MEEIFAVSSFSELRRVLLKCSLRCLACGRKLGSRSAVKAYEHDGGIRLTEGNLWVYVECGNCGYQNSLQKLAYVLLLQRRGRNEAESSV
jgi:transcription elongation factor Elf1